MEIILTLDKWLFHFINTTCSNPIFDWLMPIITNQKNWIPIYIFLLLFLIVKYKSRGLWITLIILLSFGITDYFGGHILKDAIGRLRPCASLSDVHLLVGCGSGKSFPSLHSANNFGIALILSRYFRSNSWIFYTLASLIAISRVFVGVHYPLDIFGGAIMGSIIAFAVIYIFEKIKLFKLKK